MKAYLPTTTARSPLMVPGSDFCGSVAPISFLPYLMTPSPSQTYKNCTTNLCTINLRRVCTISVRKQGMFLPLQVQDQSWESHTTHWRKVFPWDHDSASQRILWMEQSAWWQQACNLFSQIGSQPQKSEFFSGREKIRVQLTPSQMYRYKTKQSKHVINWISGTICMYACT